MGKGIKVPNVKAYKLSHGSLVVRRTPGAFMGLGWNNGNCEMLFQVLDLFLVSSSVAPRQEFLTERCGSWVGHRLRALSVC